MMASEIDTLQVQVHLRIPGIFGHGSGTTRLRFADIVDQDIDSAVSLHASVNELLYRRAVCDICFSHITYSASSFDAGFCSLRRLEGSIAAKDQCALFRQFGCDCGTDAPALVGRLAEAGNEDDFSGQV
jgi:hypothetical protein